MADTRGRSSLPGARDWSRATTVSGRNLVIGTRPCRDRQTSRAGASGPVPGTSGTDGRRGRGCPAQAERRHASNVLNGGLLWSKSTTATAVRGYCCTRETTDRPAVRQPRVPSSLRGTTAMRSGGCRRTAVPGNRTDVAEETRQCWSRVCVRAPRAWFTSDQHSSCSRSARAVGDAPRAGRRDRQHGSMLTRRPSGELRDRRSAPTETGGYASSASTGRSREAFQAG